MGSFWTRDRPMSSVLAGTFSTTGPPGKYCFIFLYTTYPDLIFFFNVFVFLLQQKKNRDFVWFTAAYLTWNSVLHIIDIQYLCYYLFRLHCIPCGIPVPQPGTEPGQGNESIKCWPLDCQDLPIFVGWIDESHMKLKIFKKWIWKKCGFSTELNGHINGIK